MQPQLFGGDGNDGLFGGAGNNTLYGDSGADRFLAWIRTGFTDTISDLTSSDARIKFTDTNSTNTFTLNAVSTQFGAASWSEAEILQTDVALGNFHKLTNNIKLLKRADGTEIGFIRYGTQLNNPGVNYTGINHGDGRIGFMSGLFPSGATYVAETVYHELGHNWDDPTENTFNAAAFRNLSGWVQSASSPGSSYTASSGSGDTWWYLNTAQFARDYSKTNPFEDYATNWETYFTELFHGVGASGNSLVSAKLNNAAAFVTWITTP